MIANRTTMSSMDVSQGNISIGSVNEDSGSSLFKSAKKFGVSNFSTIPIKLEDQRDRGSFYKDLYQYHDNKG